MGEDELRRSIERLTVYEKRLASLRYSFWRGVFYGFGFFIGSAILATVIISLLSQFGADSFLGRILNRIIEVSQGGRF